MKFSLADRRAMIEAMMGDEGPFVWKRGAVTKGTVNAVLRTERYEAQGEGGDIVSTLKRSLMVVSEDVAAAAGDTFTLGDDVWKIGGLQADEGKGFVEWDLKKV